MVLLGKDLKKIIIWCKSEKFLVDFIQGGLISKSIKLKILINFQFTHQKVCLNRSRFIL